MKKRLSIALADLVCLRSSIRLGVNMPPNLRGGSVTRFLDRGLSDIRGYYIYIYIVYVHLFMCVQGYVEIHRGT